MKGFALLIFATLIAVGQVFFKKAAIAIGEGGFLVGLLNKWLFAASSSPASASMSGPAPGSRVLDKSELAKLDCNPGCGDRPFSALGNHPA